ncbi:ral guanine nucleotide dissociation stimulator-like 2 [Polyodon spathula]|uniref:ral guanine nucleotide dissociation stimulator-like 2 n=1 Tax=Polyodon spathula TaxID=7913 RepID=UPI001B7EA7AC|nr:ral guanine nucleotide dissociation stimulator-like 2 [Polyodon spathula]
MLPRGIYYSGLDLPGREKPSVTLSSFRPHDPDDKTTPSQNDDITASHSSQHAASPQVGLGLGSGLMKTKWYCTLETPPPAPVVEEREEEGAVYTVTRRQQQSQHSATRGQPWHGDGVGHSETCLVRSIKAGTVDRLVHHLLDCNRLGDSSYVSVFLSTYRTFSSPGQVLRILLDRLEFPPVDSAGSAERHSRKRLEFNNTVSSVFSTWLEGYPEDFRALGDPSLLERLVEVLRTRLPGSEVKGRALVLLREVREEQQTQERRAPVSDSDSTLSSPIDRSDSDLRRVEPTDVLGFPSSVIAEQLSRIETALFLRVVPYHCLGSLWSQRDKKGKEQLCPSVRATVRQFNQLTSAVMTSCLGNTALRSQQRARLIEKWIRAAEECRARKNFSSLYAIISALQSNGVHRLKRTWEETSREAVRSYEELSQIFSEEDNYSHSRELLKEEGTSKFANVGKKHPESSLDLLNNFSLSSLTVFRVPCSRFHSLCALFQNGYINFDKRRKEFEIIAQIRLLQSSCKNSTFQTDESFMHWYSSLPRLSEAESYRLSCEIEPPGELTTPTRTVKPAVIITHCTDLLSSIASPAGTGGLKAWDRLLPLGSPQGAGDEWLEYLEVPDSQLKPVNPLLSRITKHRKSPSVSCLDAVASAPGSNHTPSPQPSTLTPPRGFVKSHRRSASCGSAPPLGTVKAESDMRIIRVEMGLEDGNMYRSILVSSNDKAPTVISKALEKHNQDPSKASQYELVQVLPERKELTIPSTGNVFYAMKSSSVDFLLRKKGMASPQVRPMSSDPNATFPRIKSKGLKIARAFF